MKILFLTPRNSEKYLGGLEGHVRILTEELVKRGHQVKELALDEIDGLNKGPALLRQGRALGYKFRAWGYLWRNRDLFKWADVVHIHDVFWWVMPFAIVNKGPALLQDCHVPLKAGLAMTKTLVFVTFHGWEGVCPPSWSAVIQKRLASWLSNGTIGVGSFYEKWYGVKTDRVVWGVVTPVVRLPLPWSTSTRRGVATTGFGRTDGFFARKNPGPSEIVFLGRMEKVNGVEVLLEALDKLINRQIDKLRWYSPQVIFVGEGSYRKQAEKFGKVTGMIKDPQKYLVDADIVITSSYMSMLEAAAMGKPVIAIGNSELKEDYLKTHPLRKWIRICRNPEGLIREIGGIRGIRRELDLARQWAVGQTPERLADVYEGLWNLK